MCRRNRNRRSLVCPRARATRRRRSRASRFLGSRPRIRVENCAVVLCTHRDKMENVSAQEYSSTSEIVGDNSRLRHRHSTCKSVSNSLCVDARVGYRDTLGNDFKGR